MPIKQQLGFSMLEVLISLVIIMFGLLGIAGTQMLAINNTENARYQGVANTLASSMTSMMRGNFAYWGTPRNITITGVKGGTASQTVLSSGFGTVPTYVDCSTSLCSASQVAYYDLLNWGRTVATRLPAGTSTIACGTDIPTTCSVTLNWSENNVAVSNDNGTKTGVLASGVAGARSFQTLVAIVI
jgi:type IV pilus assembly protein PilV